MLGTIPKIRTTELAKAATLPSCSSETKKEDFKEEKKGHHVQRLRRQWGTERQRYDPGVGKVQDSALNGILTILNFFCLYLEYTYEF